MSTLAFAAFGYGIGKWWVVPVPVTLACAAAIYPIVDPCPQVGECQKALGLFFVFAYLLPAP